MAIMQKFPAGCCDGRLSAHAPTQPSVETPAHLIGRPTLPVGMNHVGGGGSLTAVKRLMTEYRGRRLQGGAKG